MPSARPDAAESIARTLAAGLNLRVLVRTVTGLEPLAAAELAEAGHRVIDMSRRQLTIEPSSARIITDPPGPADDLFLIGADVADPGRTKADLRALELALRTRLAIPLPHDPGEALSVSASFLGKRTYNRFDVEDLVGAVIAEHTAARYHSRRDGAQPPLRRVDWRVVLDGTRARVAVRPFDAPLHRRDWRTQTVTGSLHPPVAAALARLARIEAGHRVVDPFSGAGTILLEAHQIEPRAIYTGIDRDPDATAAARANTAENVAVTWRTGDAGRIDLLGSAVDRIVTNPPWDVRLAIDDFPSHVRLWRRAIRPCGLLVAIVNHHQAQALIEDARWRVIEVHDVAVAGQHPRIVVAAPTPAPKVRTG